MTSRFINALLRQEVDCTPVWMMRQAGRYLPEYRKVRQHAGDFLTLCKTPELACEVTLQPLARFPMDAAIIFSDILTIPDAMGLGLYFAENEGPKFHNPICQQRDVDSIAIPDPNQDLSYVMDAIRMVRQDLAERTPLIGFSGSPWTLACYMIEGGGSKTFSKIKAMMYREPAMLHQLLEKLSQAIILYLNAQIAAGADTVMVFDTWGGVLSTPCYQQFSLQYMEKIINGIDKQRAGQRIPNILFTKNGGQWLSAIADSGCDAVGLDWTVEIASARQQIGDRVALQGNMDPCALYGTHQSIEQTVQQILQGFGQGSGHVFNLGHGINPDVPPENVACFVEAVHKYSRAMR